MNMDINVDQIRIDTLQLRQNQTIDILRLDTIHENVSGNKYFKLIHNVNDAIAKGHRQIVTLGGAFSNHLHATAYLCNQLNIQSIGIIRGQEVSNPTLTDCANWGMEFCFTDYVNWVNINYKQLRANIANQYPDAYFIPMGGDNMLGVDGMQLIQNQIANYDVIICSVGTGTTLAGVIKYSLPHQFIIGIQAVKDATVLENIKYKSGKENFILLDEFTFGGFANHDARLIHFMQQIQDNYGLPLDFVYTAKSLFAYCNGACDTFINPYQKVLFIHTGGLQGNRGVSDVMKVYGK
jgi:1-aminocyclopropane-1-carboxylate deaminase